MSLDLQMPTERPSDAPLCNECSMKHGQQDECWDGILPPGMLPLPTLDKYETGRDLVDSDTPEEELSSEKDKEKGLMEMVKSGAIKMAKNVKKKGK